MRINVQDARALAQALTAGADQAQSAGQTDFELGDALKTAAAVSEQELEAAIKSAG